MTQRVCKMNGGTWNGKKCIHTKQITVRTEKRPQVPAKKYNQTNQTILAFIIIGLAIAATYLFIFLIIYCGLLVSLAINAPLLDAVDVTKLHWYHAVFGGVYGSALFINFPNVWFTTMYATTGIITAIFWLVVVLSSSKN